MNKKIFTIWMTLAILLSTIVVIGQMNERVHASDNNDFIQVEQKIWDVQTQEWVDASDVVVGSVVKFKCTITNTGSYYFSSVKITVTFPGTIDYLSSGVAPYYVSADNKIIMINCPDQSACLIPGETWSFESLTGVVVAIGDGENKMEITAIKDDGSEFYDFDTVTLNSTIVGKIVQVEQKIWDAETQEWVDDLDVTVDDLVTFKCTITNLGPYDFSSIIIGVTLSSTIDYYGSGVAPYYVSLDKKTISINVPSQAACLYSGGTWSFESLVGIVVSSGDGYSKMEISPFTAEGYQFYDFDNVNLHSSDAPEPGAAGWIYGWVLCTNDSGTFPLEGAFVNFIFTYGEQNEIVINLNSNGYTDSNGYYEIQSLEPGTYDLVASKDGYRTRENQNVVVSAGLGTKANFNLSEGSDSEYGWFSGTLSASTINGGTFPLEGVLIEVSTLSGELLDSAYTDSDGNFKINDLKFGRYQVTITYKNGDVIKNEIVIDENYLFNNFELMSVEVPNAKLINEAINKGDVGGKISIREEQANTFQHNISIYNGVEIKNLDIKKGAISFVVSGNETSGGKTIVIDIDGSVFDPSSQILVNYDGESINMADDINDILDPNDDGAHPEYLIVLGSNGAQLLVSIPHFSEHSITFFNLTPEQTAQYLLYAAIAAVGLIIIAAVVMFRKGKED